MSTAFARKFLVLGTKKKTDMAAAGCSRYSAAKGRQFRLALPQDDSNDSDDRRQYSGPVLFQRYTAQTRDTVESNEQSSDSNVENAASQIHPNYMFVVLARPLAFILHLHRDRNFCM